MCDKKQFWTPDEPFQRSDGMQVKSHIALAATSIVNLCTYVVNDYKWRRG